MKNLSTILFVMVTLKLYGQPNYQEKEASLICTFLNDQYHEKNDTNKIVYISNTYSEFSRNKKLLKAALEDDLHNKDVNKAIRKGTLKQIEELQCLPSNFHLVTNQAQVDSLEYLYWSKSGVQIDSALNVTLKEESFNEINFVPVSIGTPWFWKNYAVVSIIIAKSPSCYLYKQTKGKWEKVKDLYPY